MTQLQTSTCQFCQQPIGTPFFRFRGKDTCAVCSEAIRGVEQLNYPSAADLFKAAGAALATSIAAAFAWAAIVKATKFESGIVAVAVGWAVVWAASKLSGGKRGVGMQIIVIAFSLLAIYLGKNLTIGWALWDDIVAKSGRSPSELLAVRIEFLLFGAIRTFEPFDLIWYGIVAFGGWQRTKAIPIHLEGPYSATPSSPNPAAPSLQFDKAVYDSPPTLPRSQS